MQEQSNYCTLEDYQKGRFEISEDDFIYYINNKNFYSLWGNLIPPKSIFAKYSGPKEFFKNLIRLVSVKFFKNSNHDKKNIYFLGHNHMSINSTEYIKEVLNSTYMISGEENVVVLGKGDYEITDDFSLDLPGNIRYIFANNINTNSSRYRFLPMGRDFRSSEYFSETDPSYIKERLCYCNYSVTTHNKRKLLYDSIRNKEFIEFDHMGKFLNYDISRLEFFNKVSKSKFTICPRGNGIDTFRLWDSLYLGAIPIVVKEAVFHQYLDDLPILFLDSYEDFAKLNIEFLEENYQNMLRKKYNYNKLLLSYWINEIEGC